MALEKSWRWFGFNDPISLADLRQMGVEGVVTALHHIPNGEIWPIQEIMAVKTAIESYGMRWTVVESLPVSEGIKIRNSDCDRLISNYLQSLKNLGQCGIDTVCYNFMPVLDWVRTDWHHTLPNGCETMLFDYATFAAFDVFMLRRPHAETQYEPALLAQAEQIAYTMPAEEQEKLSKNILVVSQAFIDGVLKDADRSADFEYKTAFLSFLENYQAIDESTLRQHLVLFLREVIPVAEQYGVNLCIHPDDPPFPILGLPRIVSTLSDLEWICDQVPSLHNGLTFCTGSLSVNPQNDLNAVVEKLAPRIHFAHLRNNRRTGYRTFYESGHLEGDIDMYPLLKTLLNEQRRRKASGRKDDRIPFRPDHGLTMLDDFHRSANPGYPLVGRLKGLAELSGMQLAIEKELNH